MKKLMLGLAVLAMGLPAFARTIPAAARSVSVTASNPGKGVVQLAFGEAPESDTTTYHLFAVRAAEDKGVTREGWEETRYLGAIPSTLTATTVRLPAEWFTSAGKIRFVIGDLPFQVQSSYLRSAGSGWFETGYTPTKDTETTVTCSSSFAVAVFGIAGWHIAFHNGGTGFSWNHFGNVVPNAFQQDWYKEWDLHTWQLGPSGMIVDGHLLQGPYTTFNEGTCPQTISLFGRKNASTGAIEKQGAAFIRRAQIRENGELVRDYIPCVSKTGVNGFYDDVSGQFVTEGYHGTLNIQDNEKLTVPTFGVFETMSVSDLLDFGNRTFEVTSFNRQTGAVTLSFGTGLAKQLYAVHDDLDKGLDWLDWKENAYLGEVAAAATTGSFALPTNWLTTRGTVRFVLSDTDALPEGYTRIEYVGSQNNAQQTIDTGVYPDSKTSIRIVTNVGEGPCSFGVVGGYLVFVNGGGGIFTSFLGTGPSISGARYPELGTKHVIDFGPDGVRIAGKRYFDPFVPTSDGPLSTTLTLMKRHAVQSGDNEKVGSMSVYSAYIERDGIALRSYVPALRTSDNKFGMWDFITKELHADSGVALTHGAATTAHELLPHTGKSVSAAFNLGPVITVTEFDSQTGALSVSLTGAVGRGDLYLTGAVADLGTLPSAWTDTVHLATLAAGATSWTGAVPADFLGRTHKTMRLFFVADVDKPFGQEVEWLSGYGFFFETGYVPDCYTQTEIEQATEGTSHPAPTGILDYHCLRSWEGNHALVSHFGNLPDVPVPVRSINELIAYSFGLDGVFVNGELKAGPFHTFTSRWSPNKKAMGLAGSRNDATGAIGDQATQCIGKCRIRHNGSVVRDFVPCVKDETPGFWDYQRQVFVANSISGKSVTAGPAVVAPLTDATFGSCSEPFQRQVGMIMIVK